MKQYVSRRKVLGLLAGAPWPLLAAAPHPPSQRVTYWARQVMRLVVKYQQNPLRAARALSYVQVALRDGWTAGAADGAAEGDLEAEAAVVVRGERIPVRIPDVVLVVGSFVDLEERLREALDLGPDTREPRDDEFARRAVVVEREASLPGVAARATDRAVEVALR